MLETGVDLVEDIYPVVLYYLSSELVYSWIHLSRRLSSYAIFYFPKDVTVMAFCATVCNSASTFSCLLLVLLRCLDLLGIYWSKFRIICFCSTGFFSRTLI